MSRKTIISIVAGVLAAAVLAAVGIVSYHVGFDHGAGRGVAGLRGPLRGYGLGSAFTRRDAAFPLFGTFLVLLIGGIVGAAIVYLARAGGHPAGAIPAGHATTPGTGRPVDPRWQQFEEWHRYAHYPAAPSAAAPVAAPGPAATGPAPGAAAVPAPPPGPAPGATAAPGPLPDPAPGAPAAAEATPAETPPADE